MKKNKFLLLGIIVFLLILLQPNIFNPVLSFFTKMPLSVQLGINKNEDQETKITNDSIKGELKKLTYDGIQQVIQLNNNQATFTSEELTLTEDHWEDYSSLDVLNRVGEANALLSVSSMPTEERKSISHIKPTGWHNKKILFNGKTEYLYNRSHLIGFQLTGQNDNIKNLFTGTRALNANFENPQSSMVYYENLTANYLKETNHHVRYQVTPVFKGIEKVCRGVRMQAKSIEDDGLTFDIFIFNVQPGYEIDYLTGKSEKL